jgi:predicted transcriptional regulator
MKWSQSAPPNGCQNPNLETGLALLFHNIIKMLYRENFVSFHIAYNLLFAFSFITSKEQKYILTVKIRPSASSLQQSRVETWEIVSS